jgi:hypothetical protein
MNAPVRVSEVHALGSLEDFAEFCKIQVWFCDNGWVSLHTAVDNSQRLAERWLLVDEYGQDAVQELMADAFAPREAEPEIDLPSDYAAQLMRQWDFADPRDSWKHTGDRPPADSVRNSDISGKPAIKPRRNGPAQSTIDAFWCVVHTGEAKRLSDWLLDHSDVAAALLKGVGLC